MSSRLYNILRNINGLIYHISSGDNNYEDIDYFIKKENREYIVYFLGGSLTIIIFFFGFINIFKIPLENFIQQYFLFPLSIFPIRRFLNY